MLGATALDVRTAFAGRHVLSLDQYGRGELDLLFAVADEMVPLLRRGVPDRPLENRILMSAFFEPSTRTRLVHEAAALRLGGAVSGFADPAVTRANGSTGESELDIARMLDIYADVVVVRHPRTGAPAEMAGELGNALLINGGDGTGEHPTQAMVDLYTLRRRFGSLDGLRVLIVNDLRMRCVNSLLIGLRLYGCEVFGLAAPGKTRAEPAARTASVEPPTVLESDIRELLPKMDAVYSSPTVALADDGADPPPSRIDHALLRRHAADHLAVLHPLPRKAELATDVDHTPYNAYWRQAEYGLAVRMALLKLMFAV